MPDYPGLGQPLRSYHRPNQKHYSIGAHASCWGAQSDILPVRELAMMSIMDRLTDKEDWHEKVFDEDIVCEWEKETRAISDEELSGLATSGKYQKWDEDGRVVLSAESSERIRPLQNIMADGTFEMVNRKILVEDSLLTQYPKVC